MNEEMMTQRDEIKSMMDEALGLLKKIKSNQDKMMMMAEDKMEKKEMKRSMKQNRMNRMGNPMSKREMENAEYEKMYRN